MAQRLVNTFVIALLGTIGLLPEQVRGEPALLVVAPDRGFAGNEDTRAAVATIDANRKEVVFVTDRHSRKYLEAAIQRLNKAQTNKMAVLPMFLTAEEPRWAMARNWLHDGACADLFDCHFSAPFGDSYLAADMLNRTIEQVAREDRRSLVLVSSSNGGDAEALRGAWRDMAQNAPAASHFDRIDVFVWQTRGNTTEQSATLGELVAGEGTAVVSWHLGWKMDSMMSFDGMLKHRLFPDIGNRYQARPITKEDLALWMQRESNRHLLRSADEIGVVVLAHGADFHWNEAMRSAIAPLRDDYTIELAFSMADRASIAAALGRLEERGMRGAVIVRVFGIEDSFRRNVERMVGMDIELDRAPDFYMSEGGGMPGMRSRPIQNSLVVTSVGGLDDHPLFAAGLLARAEEVSEDPADETLILVGHGRGDDVINDLWLNNLQSLAEQMRAKGGDKFRAIHYGTWREDWPEKRDESVRQIRELVTAATENGGRAILIPARTASGGPARRLLPDLEFVEAEGFAPHPLFTDWVESQIVTGINMLRNGPFNAPDSDLTESPEPQAKTGRRD